MSKQRPTGWGVDSKDSASKINHVRPLIKEKSGINHVLSQRRKLSKHGKEILARPRWTEGGVPSAHLSCTFAAPSLQEAHFATRSLQNPPARYRSTGTRQDPRGQLLPCALLSSTLHRFPPVDFIVSSSLPACFASFPFPTPLSTPTPSSDPPTVKEGARARTRTGHFQARAKAPRLRPVLEDPSPPQRPQFPRSLKGCPAPITHLFLLFLSIISINRSAPSPSSSCSPPRNHDHDHAHGHGTTDHLETLSSVQSTSFLCIDPMFRLDPRLSISIFNLHRTASSCIISRPPHWVENCQKELFAPIALCHR